MFQGVSFGDVIRFLRTNIPFVRYAVECEENSMDPGNENLQSEFHSKYSYSGRYSASKETEVLADT